MASVLESQPLDALSPRDFLVELVKRESPSGAEAQAAELAVQQMRQLGYREAYIDAAGNAIGFWGKTNPARRIILLGHIDTVAGIIPVRVAEQPSELSFLREAHPILYGRGAVDAKGPFATFIHAVASLPPRIDTEVVVVGAVEEEASSSKGARQVLKDFWEPKLVIIGEPSHTTGVTLGYKGRLVYDFTTSREMTHGAHQHVAAAELAFAVHQAIKEAVNELNHAKHGAFAVVDYTVQALNTKSDGFVETVTMTGGFRLGPEFTPQLLEQQLSAKVAKTLDANLSYTLSFKGHEIPVQFDKRLELVRVFRNAIRQHKLEPRLLLKTGTSDMNVLAAKWQCPMVAYGPGDSALDHTPHERISLCEYDLAIKILADALQSLIA